MLLVEKSRSVSSPLGAERDLRGRDLVKDLGVWPNPRKPPLQVKERLPSSSLSLTKLPALRWAPLRELQVKRLTECQHRGTTRSGDQLVVLEKRNVDKFASKNCLQDASAMDASTTSFRRAVLPMAKSLPNFNPDQPKAKERPKLWNKVYYWNEAGKSGSCPGSSLGSRPGSRPVSGSRQHVATSTEEAVPRKEATSMVEDTVAKSSCDDRCNNGCSVISSHLGLGDWLRDTSPRSHNSTPRPATKCSAQSRSEGFGQSRVVQLPNLNGASQSSRLEKDDLLSARDAFSRHHQNNFVTTGQNLGDALACMGIVFVFHEVLEATNLALTTGRMALDFEDFSLVADAYISQHLDVLRAAFNRKARSASSGKVEPRHLPGILAEVGIRLMLGFEQDLPTVPVDFETFITVYYEVSQRAGLTVAEYRRISGRLQGFLCSRKMMSSERALDGLGFTDMLLKLAGGESVVETIIGRIFHRAAEGTLTLDIGVDIANSVESNACIDFTNRAPHVDLSVQFRVHVYFIVARIIHERISQGLLSITGSFGFDFERSRMCQEDLVPILEECGFIQTVFQGVTPFIEECGFKEQPMLGFGEVYTVVLRFCLADGLTESDRHDITLAFNEIDDNGDGVLTVGELKGVIRWLGYQPTVHRVYNFAEEFGITETSCYTCDEFIELMSKFFRMNMWSAWTRLYGPKRECGHKTHRLPIQELGKLLSNLGYEVTQGEVDNLIAMAGGAAQQLSFADFKELELKYRHHVRNNKARSGGLTGWEVAKYTKHFNKYADNDGFISHKQMRELLIGLFPTRFADKNWNLRLVEKVKQIDPQSTGKFDLRKYMALRQSLADELDGDVLMEGLRLRQELGYSRDEIKQFRELYSACDSDLSGSLDFDEVLQIFAALVDLSSEGAKRELKSRFSEIDDGDHELTFFEFLQLVHQLQKENWRNINLAAGGRQR